MKKEKNSIVSQFFLLILHPKDFFLSVQGENPNKAVLWTFVGLIVFIIGQYILGTLRANGLVIPWILDKVDPTKAINNAWIMIIAAIVSFCVNLFGIPIWNFLAKELGAKKTWRETVQAEFYPTSVYLLLAWIPIVNYIIFFYHTFLSYRGFQTLHGMTRNNYIVYWIVFQILALLLMIIISIVVVKALLLLFFGPALAASLI